MKIAKKMRVGVNNMGIFKKKNVENKSNNKIINDNIDNATSLDDNNTTGINNDNATSLNNDNVVNINNDNVATTIIDNINNAAANARKKLNSVEPEILEKHIEKYGDKFLVKYSEKDKGQFDKFVLTAKNKGKNIPVSKYNENGIYFLNWSERYVGGFQNNIIPMYELISKDTILGFMELMVDTHDEFVGKMIGLVRKWESEKTLSKPNDEESEINKVGKLINSEEMGKIVSKCEQI